MIWPFISLPGRRSGWIRSACNVRGDIYGMIKMHSNPFHFLNYRIAMIIYTYVRMYIRNLSRPCVLTSKTELASKAMYYLHAACRTLTQPNLNKFHCHTAKKNMMHTYCSVERCGPLKTPRYTAR